jgi:hypothetical protein
MGNCVMDTAEPDSNLILRLLFVVRLEDVSSNLPREVY